MTASAHLSQRAGRGLILIGYRGSGKSTVGKIVADRLGRPFRDTDLEIEARSGRSIAAIFAEEAEPSFRDWEERTLAELAGEFPEAVLATGGGVVLREANRRRIRDFGFVAWLQAPPEELARRLETDPRSPTSRPALTHAGTLGEIAQVLAVRAPIYRELADATVETEGKSADWVASALIDRWLVGLY
ncbi:MAG: shikimate kinase [Isosphaeraceae bacterium]